MNLPLFFADSDANSLIIAITIIAAICVIMLTAMIKYDADGALKIWAALGTLTGLVTGSMAAYFFTEKANQAEKAAGTAREQTLTTQLLAEKTEKDLLSNLAAYDGSRGRLNLTTSTILKLAADENQQSDHSAPAKASPEAFLSPPIHPPVAPGQPASSGQ
jgi:hypothetical protein